MIVITRDLKDLNAGARFYRRLEEEGRIVVLSSRLTRSPDGTIFPSRARLLWEWQGHSVRVRMNPWGHGVSVRALCPPECVESVESLLSECSIDRIRLVRDRLDEARMAEIYARLSGSPISGTLRLDADGRFIPRRVEVETGAFRVELTATEVAVEAYPADLPRAAEWLQELLVTQEVRMHILVGRRSEKEWHVPKNAAAGDAVLFLAGDLTAHGRIDTAPVRDSSRKGYYLATVRGRRELPRPQSLAELRAALPGWKYLAYPRSCVTVPPEIATRLRELVGL